MIRGGDKGQSGLDMAGGQGSVPDLPHQSCPPHPIPPQVAQTWQGCQSAVAARLGKTKNKQEPALLLAKRGWGSREAGRGKLC